MKLQCMSLHHRLINRNFHHPLERYLCHITECLVVTLLSFFFVTAIYSRHKSVTQPTFKVWKMS